MYKYKLVELKDIGFEKGGKYIIVVSQKFIQSLGSILSLCQNQSSVINFRIQLSFQIAPSTAKHDGGMP